MTNEQLDAAINAMWKATKAGALQRAERFEAIQELTDSYVETNGKRPPHTSLDRLATMCLFEEDNDPTPYKIRNTEYAFHSERRENRKLYNEVGDGALGLLSTDGTMHRPPGRRKREKWEQDAIDKEVKRKWSN